jgi:hypothetical protein
MSLTPLEVALNAFDLADAFVLLLMKKFMTAHQHVSVAGIESAGRGDRNFNEERALNIIANTFQLHMQKITNAHSPIR